MSYCRWSTDDEIWLPVDGWPYEVSSMGNIRRSAAGRSPIAKVGRYLKPCIADGYRTVVLCDIPRKKTIKVANLVCAAFHGASPSLGYEVRHLDGVRINDFPDNLSWGTRKQNSDDKDRHGRLHRGEKSWSAKLTQSQVDELRLAHSAALVGRKRVPRGWIPAASEKYGVTTHSITGICGGKGYVVL